MQGVTTSADGIAVRFDVEGSGRPAVVLVHGWSCDRTYWRGQLRELARSRRVVAVDLGGHGESDGGRRDWTMPAFGEDVAAVVDALELPDAVLVGHSMGGDVVLEAALRLADGVSGIVWVDVYTTLDRGRTAAEVEAVLEPLRRDFVGATQAMVRAMFPTDADPELVAWVAADMASADPEIAIDAMAHSISNYDAVVAALERLVAPVVTISPSPRPTNVEQLLVRGVRTVPIAGVGHFPMLEDPAGFNRVLEKTLAALPDSTE